MHWLENFDHRAVVELTWCAELQKAPVASALRHSDGAPILMGPRLDDRCFTILGICFDGAAA